jgi:hypothetical protein
MSNYYHLGKLSAESINFFKEQVLSLRNPEKSFQWVQLNENIFNYFDSIFENSELKVQTYFAEGSLKRVQKVFYSEKDKGFRIHKDGLQCKAALNIAISCNDADWVRWYDEDYVNSLDADVRILNQDIKKSRDIEIYEYDSIPFIEEIHNQEGDVYLVNTDVYHSYKCLGPNPRIVLQTKFENFPDIEFLYQKLQKKSFKNLIK